MRTIIAGSRDIEDYDLVREAIQESGFEITEVVCGKARGVDTLGERWAKEKGIHVAYHPADWEKHGKAAGPIRNRQMAQNADALIAVHDGISPGTRNMIEEARKRGLKVYIKLV